MGRKALIVIVVAIVVIASSMAIFLSNNGKSETAKVLTWQSSVAFGNLNNETYQRCAVDADGNLYTLGTTDGPEDDIANGYDSTYNGSRDLIVIKYAPDLTSVIASSYLGGNGWENPWGIKIGNNGDVYIMGSTNSSDFPTTEGAYDRVIVEDEAFIAELSPDLITLQHSTFFGDCRAFNMIFDDEGNIFICGDTEGFAFPTTSGAYDQTHAGKDDAYVAKISPDLSTLMACTLLGGPSYDSAHSLALDDTGHVYIAGETFFGYVGEDNANHIPTTPGAFGSNVKGQSEGFVTEFSSDLGTLIASTTLGGSNYDNAHSISVRADGSILVGGSTHSADFPMTSDAMNSNHRFPIDAFICEMSPDLKQLKYSSFLGLGDSHITTMLEDSDGMVYLSCYASSITSSMPTSKDAFDTTWGGANIDGFVTILSCDLKKINYASYIGGNRDEECTIGLGADGWIYVVGYTWSTDIPTLEDNSRSQASGYWIQSDGFVLRFKYV